MAEGTLTGYVRKVVAKAEPYLPQIPKPKRKVSLQTKLLWCGACVCVYMVMGQTPLFGATTPEFDFLCLFLTDNMLVQICFYFGRSGQCPMLRIIFRLLISLVVFFLG